MKRQHIALFLIISHYTTFNYTMLHHIKLYYVILHYTTLHYLLFYAILFYFVILYNTLHCLFCSFLNTILNMSNRHGGSGRMGRQCRIAQ